MSDNFPILNSEGEIVIRIGNRDRNYHRRSKNISRSLEHGFSKVRDKNIPPWNMMWANPESHADFFDLGGLHRKDLPYFAEAEASAERGRKLLLTRTDKRKSPTRLWDNQSAQHKGFFAELREGVVALSSEDHLALIDDAAAHCDEEFFVHLADVIRARWKRDAPNTLRLQMAFCWTKCLLWLMTDDAATQFLLDYVRFESRQDSLVKMTTYTKAKHDLDLIQHPRPPIVKVETDGRLFGQDNKEIRFVQVK